MNNSFYESGYVDPKPKKSSLLNAVDMLCSQGYKRVAVCVNHFRQVDVKPYSCEAGLLQELESREEEFVWIKYRRQLEYKGAKVWFFVHGKDEDLIKLRGPVFDAAIVKGKLSYDFNDSLSWTLRLGDYPVKIFI